MSPTNKSYSCITCKELNELKKHAIKRWHFEDVEGGVVPVSDEDMGVK